MTATTTEERQLRWFNELKKKEAVGALLLVCHSRKWATRVAAGRPYDDADALLDAADRIWLALEPQDWLAETSQHAGASVFDLVIAATAEHHHLTVLHDDRDYEVISRVTGLPTQRVID